MIRHDFRCTKCNYTYEISFASSLDFRREWPCPNCAGIGIQIWLKAPGLAGVEEPGTRGVDRSFIPGMDIQSGRYFNTRAERDRYVKSKGLELMGPKEWDRTRKNLPSREPKVDETKLVDACEHAWQDLTAGRKAPPMEKYKDEDVILNAKEN